MQSREWLVFLELLDNVMIIYCIILTSALFRLATRAFAYYFIS